MKTPLSWKVLAALAAVALCGAVIGAAVALQWQHRRFVRQFDTRPGSEAFIERLAADLRLSPEQQAAIRPILDKGRADLRTVTAEAFVRAERIGRRIDQDIRPHLTPEQVRRLEQLAERRKQLRERWQAGERLLPKLREWRKDSGAATPGQTATTGATAPGASATASGSAGPDATAAEGTDPNRRPASTEPKKNK